MPRMPGGCGDPVALPLPRAFFNLPCRVPHSSPHPPPTHSLPFVHTPLQDQWRSFFTRRGYGGSNALVWANEWMAYSSTNSQLVHVLFRIRNSNPTTAISWTPFFWYTSYSGWSEAAQVIVNGNEVGVN